MSINEFTMRTCNIFKTMMGAIVASVMLTGCSDILDEQSRSSFDVSYFSTAEGVEGGITSLYYQLRCIYGQGYYYNSCETGTDEYTYGWSADSNFLDADLSGVGELTASTCRTDVLWGYAFVAINTASGVIEYGSEAGVDESLLAEAYFFRAYYYFLLVQTFGGVPLDLGAGELAFNTSASRVSTRNTVPEVYTKCVFPDLLEAIDNLPESQRVTGGVTRALAEQVLAKAYLTYAWWLENPNNIDTYPECTRTDPDGLSSSQYFQLAYDYATHVIDNPGPYSLQTTYYDVNVGSNDYNSECMLYADHTEDSEYYGGSSLSYSSGSAPENFAVWLVTHNYTTVTSSSDGSTYNFYSLQREASQAYGRPWSRMAPCVGALRDVFAERTYDSRYDGTFVTCFHGNWEKAGYDNEYVYNANGLKVYQGEAILTFLDEDVDGVDYSTGITGLDVGVLAGRADYVVEPSMISRYRYPNLWKLGTYRTDNDGGLGQPNGAITRPFVAVKFSEAYLIAAEAAVKGATTSSGKTAYDLVNVLRARAGVWNYDNNGNTEKDADYSAEMIALTPTTITIDYILDERMREYFGEGYRWFDLARTQTWAEKATTYEIGPAMSIGGDHAVATVTRTIEDYMYLRPIPTSQLDGMEMTDEEKDEYQNPGYD